MYDGTNIRLEDVKNFEKKLLKHGKILSLKPKEEIINKFFLEKGHNIEHLKIEYKNDDENFDIIAKDSVIKLMKSLREKERFIGIWALDTLLHLDRLDLYYVLNRFYQVLVEKGLIYLSFRFGEQDFFKEGKWHTCFTEKELVDLVGFTDFDILEVENKNEYINVILKK
ncbi:hypothetical protein NON08_10585 [Cetobacterium somerae]|uniref:hypothetical protein n=1 Tax=Cetobacterium sp. NK01 TaxID=2993530 RepID=UPI002115E436|nr:hypothetical protein [Cetobacterium sp. NK01]MCQ8212967.1 hypothetical protein [Cetobacterium sp. NK01]